MALEPINKAAYEVLSAMPSDEAQLILSAIVYDTLPQYIEEQTPLIQQRVDEWVSKRLGAYDRYLKRQYVERVKKNEDTTDLEAQHELISKATFDNRTYEWTPERERLHPRDARGKFRDSPYKITKPVGPMKPIRNPKAAGIPDFKAEGAKNIRPERVAELQNAYLQVVNTLKAHEQMGLGDQKFSIRGTNGTQVFEGLSEENVKTVFNQYAKTGNKPIEFKVITPQTTVGGVYFDALSSMPMSRDAAMGAYEGGRDLPGNIGQGSQFQQGWFNNSYALSENEPRFRRLKSGSELIDTFVPQSAIKTKAALAGAKYVGDLGPDAEKIIGPTARKLTYRSRGTEKKTISPELRGMDAGDRNRAILGYGQPVMGRNGKVMMSGEPGTIPGFFLSRLPNKDYWELQRKSGAVPPSEGVIIDSTGKIVSQSVGFKDDHFLPFTLKGLAKMRGGEYVRTRSTGGPTTEDIYTALIGGANSFTVVSRSGIFTVDFDPTFTGRRRYNDKAGKMVERYGKLLDAAGSGEVTLKDVDSERYAEIVEVARESTTTREDYKRRLETLLDEEKFKPKASQAMKAEMLTKARADLQEEITNGGTDFARRYSELRNNAMKQYAATPAGVETVAPTQMLAAMVEREAQERADTLTKAELGKRSFKAMQLDGEGYYASLQALREQYPYYIKEIHYHPMGKERDKGYVKPRYLRPDEVWEGYFDPDIKGPSSRAGGAQLNSRMVRLQHQEGKHGKVKASGTNYQNFRVTDPRDQAAQEAEEKASTATATSSEAKPAAAAVDAKERQIQLLADAYLGYVGTMVNDNGVLKPFTSDEIAAFGIDTDDPVRSIRNKSREESDFMSRLYGSLRSHQGSVADMRVRYNDNSTGAYQKFKGSLDAYDRETAPKVEIPADAPVGLIAMDHPDKVLSFPEIEQYKDTDITEALKRPDVVAVARKLGGTGGSLVDAATAHLRDLGDAMKQAERNRPAEMVDATPLMKEIQEEAAATARLKALLVARSQLGGSSAYQTTEVNDDGSIRAQLLGGS